MTDPGRAEPVPDDEPVPDVLEQHQDAVPGADEPEETEIPQDVPLEADVADVSEQAREGGLDDEDYR